VKSDIKAGIDYPGTGSGRGVATTNRWIDDSASQRGRKAIAAVAVIFAWPGIGSPLGQAEVDTLFNAVMVPSAPIRSPAMGRPAPTPES
jgi:hypothetical protein